MMQKAEITTLENLFIGANTCHGFTNYADECFIGTDKVYIIKGGPGTGKSTFMEKIADNAEKRGYKAVRCYCSSDNTSLDGVIIPDLKTAVTDGTSPHVMEPKYPGARERIIDFGSCLNTKWLSANAETIKRLADKKSELYQSAYKYLGVCCGLRTEIKAAASAFTLHSKADSAVRRIIGKLGRSDGFRMFTAQMTSLGMNGKTHLDSFRNASRTVYKIADSRGISFGLFDRLIKYAEEAGLTVFVSRDPMLDVDAIYLPEKSVSFIGYDEERAYETDKIINTERFVDKGALRRERDKLRFILGIEKEMTSRIYDIFKEIREQHFALEDIYKCAMDFDKKNAILTSVTDEIFGNAR